jgi:hypothetical protein
MKNAYVYFYRIVTCVKMSYIELECTWIHDCPGASNGVSIVVKIIILASARIVLQYSVMQVRGRSHRKLSCEN